MNLSAISLSKKAHDLSGQQFGRLTAIAPVGKKNSNIQWLCICVCGSEKVVETVMLNRGQTTSCGCLQIEVPNYKTHGMTKTSEYNAWATMISRCNNKNNKAYNHYGGRGIKVCSRWSCFENFYADMGNKPSPNHTLDRINNDSDYSLNNCRWATWSEQNRNKRNNHVITHNGKTKCLTAWAESLGISHSSLRYRIKHWSVSDALTKPVKRSTF